MLFLAFLYKCHGNKLLFTKHYEAAKRFKMLELGIDLRKPKFNPKVKMVYKQPTLTQEQCNSIWYSLINFFNSYEFYEISDKLLDFIDDERKNTVQYLLEKAKVLLFFKESDSVIELCDKIIAKEENNELAWILRGHAFYFKKNLFDSEESYIKGIKYNKDKKNKFDLIMLVRLGIIYIRRKTWEDAKTVFLKILGDSVYHSFAWRYLGLALTNLKEYESAEESLNEAIILDIENAYTWAYLTMFCINVKRNDEAYQCLNELLKMKFKDVEITLEIADLFEKSGVHNIASNLYKRIINIDKTFIDAQIKLSEIYAHNFDDDKKKKEAIDILKNALQYTKDEKEKQKIYAHIKNYENQEDINFKVDDALDEINYGEISKNSGGFVEDSEIKDNFV